MRIRKEGFCGNIKLQSGAENSGRFVFKNKTSTQHIKMFFMNLTQIVMQLLTFLNGIFLKKMCPEAIYIY